MGIMRRVWRHMHWRLFVNPLPDGSRSWRGLAPKDLPTMRIARFGDCACRDMTTGHGVQTTPGYPLSASRQMVESGVGVAFSDVFVLPFHDLPKTDAELTRYITFEGEPDVVLIHIGEVYVWRMFLPHHWRSTVLRDNVARWLGPLLPYGYRLLHPLLRRFGSPAERYDGCEDHIVAFTAVVREIWPSALIGVLTPYPPARDGIFAPVISERIARDLAVVCERHGLTLLDWRNELQSAGNLIYGVNGYNLNAQGGEIIGGRLADWLLAVRS